MAANIYDNGSFERSSDHFFSLSLQELHLSQLKKDFHLVLRALTASASKATALKRTSLYAGFRRLTI